MKRHFWLKLILLAVLCGLMAGIGAYALQQWIMDSASENPEPGTEYDEGNGEEDSTENKWAYMTGSYTGKGKERTDVRVTDIAGPVDSISGHHIVYVDEVKEKSGELWGHTNFCGMNLWILIGELCELSEQDYSMKKGDICYVNTVSGEDNFSYEASDEVIFMTRAPFGTELTIEDFQEESVRAVYEGKYGWISRDSVSVFYDEFPYMVCGESQYSVAFMREPDFSGEKIGMLKNETVVKFTEFNQGWGKTTIGNITGWIAVSANLVPVKDGTAITSSNLAILMEQNTEQTETEQTETEPQTEPFETDFYKDGTHNPVNGYIFPQSTSQYLSADDLSNLTLKGLCYAKNEIYARYGRKFKSKELQEYFNKQSWYNGIYEPSDQNDAHIVSIMNDCERHNKDVLYSAEKEQGMYDLDK